MYRYSKRSLDRLESCDERIQLVFKEAIKFVDITIIEGTRSNERQQEMYDLGLSKLLPGQSKHNTDPSLAIDAAPYPIDWNNLRRFTMFAGFILGIGRSNGIILRSGLDWDRDFDPTDQSFHDGPHFELVE